MIRLEGSVTYQDGHTIELVCGQAEFAAWERYALRAGLPIKAELAPPITMLRYLGYSAAHKGIARGDWPAFEDWEASVESVDLSAPEGAEMTSTPTPPVRSVG